MPRQKKPTRRQQTEMSKGISKMVRQYKRTGRITTSRATFRPKSKAAAVRQAVAIEYGRKGVGRAGAGRRRK